MKKALLIEDAPEYQLLVRAALTENFEVTFAGDADQALNSLARDTFDLILIDVGLPGQDGLSLCEQIRRTSSLAKIPILFISGRSEPSDLAQGFAAGADDYIYKPFRPAELRVRIDARMKRAELSAQPVADEFRKGDLLFMVGRQKVAHVGSETAAGRAPEKTPEQPVIGRAPNGRDLNLTPNEFKILYHLAKNEGQTLGRSDILREVWGAELHVVERTVDKHICSLRRKMGAAADTLVSVPGEGYVFRGKHRFSAAN